MSAIIIQRLTPESSEPAARLLAASMRDNPLHRRIFGDDAARIEPLLANAFARLLQRQMDIGLVLGAFNGEALAGVAAMVPPGHCQLELREKLSMLAILAGGRMLRHLPKIQRWLRVWAQQDPAVDHWHLGPAAVDRNIQGQGIGGSLMMAMCEQLDREQASGYLETDKHMNVRLYRRGGFEVVAERPVLGVTNWFMLRPPRLSDRQLQDRHASERGYRRPAKDFRRVCLGIDKSCRIKVVLSRLPSVVVEERHHSLQAAMDGAPAHRTGGPAACAAPARTASQMTRGIVTTR